MQRKGVLETNSLIRTVRGIVVARIASRLPSPLLVEGRFGMHSVRILQKPKKRKRRRQCHFPQESP